MRFQAPRNVSSIEKSKGQINFHDVPNTNKTIISDKTIWNDIVIDTCATFHSVLAFFKFVTILKPKLYESLCCVVVVLIMA